MDVGTGVLQPVYSFRQRKSRQSQVARATDGARERMGTTGSRRNPKKTRPWSVADDGNDVYSSNMVACQKKKRKTEKKN